MIDKTCKIHVVIALSLQFEDFTLKNCVYFTSLLNFGFSVAMEIERAWICKVALWVCRETHFHANHCVFGCEDGPEVDALNTARQILQAVCA